MADGLMADGANAPSAKLYTPRLLSLSAELANYPLTDGFQRTSEVRSRTCGSTLALGIDLDSSGNIARIGMQVTACAVGQSSAAILAVAAKGRGTTDIFASLAEIEAWLSGEGALPEWPGFDALEPALPHAGRHGALLLPWTAITRALSSAAS